MTIARVIQRVRERARDPAAIVLAFFAVASLVGITWGLPGTDSWASDSISPRSCGLGALALTYLPGRFHLYPPLHMALLTLLSLPWIAAAALRVGTDPSALEGELVKPLYMTGIEAGARVVAIAMGLAIVWNTMRLWRRIAGERAGVLAGAIVAANSTLVYYAHTGNLEVPYLFWVTWALVEIDRVACGEARETRALLLAAAAALTKDQAAAAFLLTLPIYVVAAPALARGERLVARASLWRAVALAAAAVLVVSGALVNPLGVRRRLALLFGPASQSWTSYPRGFAGAIAIARDAVLAVPHFTSWPIAMAALVGLVVLVLRGDTRLARARALLPFVAAASFALFFTLSARRTEDRFLLPQSVLLFPYAAVSLDRAMAAWPRARLACLLAAAAAFTPAVLSVASLDATLLADSRYAAERFLAALPAGARVEAYGGSPFLPRIAPHLIATRPGVEPIAERRVIAGITEIVDPALDPRPRAPDVIVLATELSSDALFAKALANDRESPTPYGAASYRDPVSMRFYRGLEDGSLGYARVLRAECALPWPLTCRAIHDSTATETWIYAPRASRPPEPAPLP